MTSVPIIISSSSPANGREPVVDNWASPSPSPRFVTLDRLPRPQPQSSITDFDHQWLEDDDLAPPPSNQNALIAKQETRHFGNSLTKSYNSQDPEDNGPSKPPEQVPLIESTKQLAKKRRQKKTNGEKQSVLKKSKVTKALHKGKSQPTIAETVSRHFTAAALPAEVEALPKNCDDLGKAVSRRKDWTPTRDSGGTTLRQNTSARSRPADDFQDLLKSFGGEEEYSGNSMTIGDAGGAALGKRKVVDSAGSCGEGDSRIAASSSLKAAKKKTRTLTELATAAYAPDSDGDKASRPAPTRKNARPDKKLPTYETDTVTTRRGAKSLVKASTTKSKEFSLPILLSPPKAREKAESQHFIFGTSSQLAEEQTKRPLSNPQSDFKFSRKNDVTQGKANQLWLAGARDERGELVEVINLVDASDVSCGSPVTSPATTQIAEDTGWQASEACAPDKPDYHLYTDAQLTREISRYGFKPLKSRKAMTALLDECWSSQLGVSISQTRTSSSSVAACSNVTTGKKRGRPKKTCATSEASTSSKMTKTTGPGRPKKPKAKLAGASQGAESKPKEKIKVIADSDSEAVLSSDDESNLLILSSQLARTLASSAATSEELSPLSAPTTPNLSAAITEAVRSAPRSTNPHQPSWHEKMLMYDPIIIEEFSSWLNGGQLLRVGWDNKVDDIEVKKWCESKSICCLWKKTLKGRERKRLNG